MESKSQSAYKAGLENGFDTLLVYNYYSMNNEVSHISTKTPFTYHVEPLIGVADVDLSKIRSDELRGHHSKMFATPSGRNIEDVHESKYANEGAIMVKDERTGKDVPYFQALDEMGEFVAGASVYPHVESEYEFCMRSKVRDALNDDVAKLATYDYSSQYGNYLQNCLTDMNNGAIYVGEIKTSDELYSNGEFTEVQTKFIRDEARHSFERNARDYVKRLQGRKQTVMDAFHVAELETEGFSVPVAQ